jgi:hypothetical protein
MRVDFGTLGGRRDFYFERVETGSANPMDRHHPQRRFGPLTGALTVAAFGLLSLLIVDHGPWNRPHAQGHVYATTAAAARAVGAKVIPTEPKPVLEPVAPGPKPAQPVNPAP